MGDPPSTDPRAALDRLFRDLRSGPGGLSGREAGRRLTAVGPNALARRARGHPLAEVGRQLTHPLALLLWAAAALALLGVSTPLAVAIVVVILLNAAVAVVQERQAERAVEALRDLLPPRAVVVRDGARVTVAADTLVPGDVLVIEEGDRISADARLIEGGVEVDMSPLTGESEPVYRAAGADGHAGDPLHARDVVFSGTSCTGGEAHALVTATGARTELGRIAALSQRAGREPSPLEEKVRRAAWVIALVAVLAGLAFLAIGTLVAGLPVSDSVEFAIGLLVANVPEGLLPTITLALAVAVRSMARRGALVKRLSAVETLGSTDVICTDKTGTLTMNRMRATAVWTTAGRVALDGGPAGAAGRAPPVRALAGHAADCVNATLVAGDDEETGDPTEVAVLAAAAALGADPDPARRERARLSLFRFDPALRRMTTVSRDGPAATISTKGAPEAVLLACGAILDADGREAPLTAEAARGVREAANRLAAEGLRVLAVAGRTIPAGEPAPAARADAERDLVLAGLVAMYDPPRPEVADAVRRCHAAGIRVLMLTGDSGITAAEIGRRVGIVRGEAVVVTGADLTGMGEDALDRLLRAPGDLVFARISPEAKLRIADALRAEGHVVAMTGDGVNDAPALRRADIGVAMGRSGAEVARESATMILVDDDFATIVAAVEEGRRVYDNVRKFILYIFAHATPEVAPFLLFALSGGAVPLPLTVMQILAIDLGTETLPALALGREPAEPGIMDRPPRPRAESVVDRRLLLRAWGVLGGVSAVLATAAFLWTLLRAGWTPGDDVGEGAPLHGAYVEATTMTFLAIVACQVGAAVACRTERSSLRDVGVFGNRLLIAGIGFSVVVSAALVAVPGVDAVFGTAVPDPLLLSVLPVFAVVVWAVDELYRAASRRRGARAGGRGRRAAR